LGGVSGKFVETITSQGEVGLYRRSRPMENKLDALLSILDEDVRE
jgi:hypothetical protein